MKIRLNRGCTCGGWLSDILPSTFEINPGWIEFFSQNPQFIFVNQFSCLKFSANLQIPACVFFGLFHRLARMQRGEDHLAGLIRFQYTEICHYSKHASAAQTCFFAIALASDEPSRCHE